MSKAVITLLTDFGTEDHYVASMKGVILSINPHCTLIDITHQVGPQDVRGGAFLLANAYSSFPRGTIHLGVVDPGVGSPREPILAVTSDYFFIGPDNGLFTLALEKETVREIVILRNTKYFSPKISPVFHGRDLFAPAAGHLSLGVKPGAFGPTVNSWMRLQFQKPVEKGQRLMGEILHIDGFGNLVTNIDDLTLFRFVRRRSLVIKVGKVSIRGLKSGYWEGKKGEVLALIGSEGLLEISVREGNAQKLLRAKKGDRVGVQLGNVSQELEARGKESEV